MSAFWLSSTGVVPIGARKPVRHSGPREHCRRERSKLRKALDEFDTYIVVNQPLIPNYGERWRNKGGYSDGLCGIGGQSDRK
jgi:hypothetical protein